MKTSFKLLVIVFFGISLPFSAKACNVSPLAKDYINKINKVVGGQKPKIIIEKGVDDGRYGFYQDGTIHIFKGDYPNMCIEDKPFLKSVIAHEYSHYIEGKIRKIVKLRGERLAFVGEHAIGDEILGDVFYDKSLKKKDILAYEKLKLALRIKNINKNFKTQNSPALSKSKR